MSAPIDLDVMPDLLTAALDIAAAGWPVFPCGANKKPLTEHGFKNATTDPDAIRAAFDHPAAAMIAVPTGRLTGFDVLDFDPRHGSDTWRRDNIHRLPETRVVRTMSGGEHWAFRHADGVRNRQDGKIAPGIDVRGEGGYVIVPPSPGYSIVWAAEIAPWPDWLLEQVIKPPRPARPSAQPQARTDQLDRRHQGFVASLLDNVRAAPDGTKHDTLLKNARALGGIIDAAGIAEADAIAWLIDALPDTAEYWEAARKTALDGLRHGRTEPITLEDRPWQGKRTNGEDHSPQPPEAKQETDDEAIERLARLPALEYERVREAEAKSRDCRVAILDKLVQQARGQDDAASGRAVALHDPDPWPDPVATDVLLGNLVDAIRRHVVLSPAAADVVALWIPHTWVYQRFDHSPRLGITSPTKRCGKSTLMEVLRLTCCRTLKADNVSASGVFRTVEALRPLTLLADEADTFLRDAEELRGVLNSGFERSGQVIRVVERSGEYVPVVFATFCPVALAAIGELPGTLGDRAAPIRLERKAASEKVQKMRATGNRAALSNLARKLTRWAADTGSALGSDPELPEAMSDREGDISVPLLAIADHAGPEWAARGRKALLEVFGLRAAAEGNAEIGALLLGDIRTLFGDADKMPSVTLCKHLAEMEDRPWPEWRQGKPITQTQLATALKPFRIRPTTIRDGDSTPKGYERKAFKEAWSRYLPDTDTPASTQDGGSEPQHRNKPGNSRDSAESQGATQADALRTLKSGNCSPELPCCGVAAEPRSSWPDASTEGAEPAVDGRDEVVV